ncbi:MAG: HEAT repeat domain-containing protein [Acidobacteria bacterium]|nr:HEAT repeat domain-containing protein [Acidobacteriota bacterium]
MFKNLVSIFLAVVLLSAVAIAEIPITIEVQILRAEDELRYDTDIGDLLKHKDAEVRRRAALAAGRIGDAAAVKALAELLANDTEIAVREMAAFALGEIESIEAADVIQRAIGETGRAKLHNVVEADIRGRLAEAAGKIAAANSKDPKAKDLGQAILFVLEAEKMQDRTEQRNESSVG